MSSIEEWWKQVELPKYKLGDTGYITDEGEVIEVTVVEITARFDHLETMYGYELEAEDGDTFFKSAEDIYTDKAVPERICRIAALEEKIKEEEKCISHARDAISYFKELTPECIKEKIEGCEEDIAKWTKNIETWKKELKELEGANGK